VIRLGLVGVGAWGRRYVDTISRRADCRIVAFARGSSGRDFALPGAIQHDSWQVLLERAQQGDLDGVIVAATPTLQADVGVAALSAGVPSLIEKPLGLSAGAVERVRDALRSAMRKPPIVVNHVHLWAPAYRQLQALVRQGGVARVSSIESEGYSKGPFRGWSSLYDYGPHDIAMCLGLMGVDAPFVLEEVCARPPAEPQGTLLQARFKLGSAKSTIRVGNGGATKCRRFTATLSDGRTLVYDDLQPHPGKLLDSGRPVPVAPEMPLDQVLGDFLSQITLWMAGRFGGEQAAASLELSARVSSILDEIAAAAAPVGSLG
jgi:predicted dehydrogenase